MLYWPKLRLSKYHTFFFPHTGQTALDVAKAYADARLIHYIQDTIDRLPKPPEGKGDKQKGKKGGKRKPKPSTPSQVGRLGATPSEALSESPSAPIKSKSSLSAKEEVSKVISKDEVWSWHYETSPA